MGKLLGTSLSAIPGIGEKTAKELSSRLGTEEAALKALKEANLPLIAGIVGSERRALRLIRAARAAELGYHPDALLGTPDSASIFYTAISHVASYAASRPGKILILSHSPAPSSAAASLLAGMKQRLDALSRVEAGQLAEAKKALSRLTWPRHCIKPKRTVVTPMRYSEEVRRAVEGLEGIKIVAYNTLEEIEGSIEQHNFNDIIIYDPEGVFSDMYPVSRRASLSSLAPEALLEEAACNRELLETVLELYRVSPTLAEAAAAQHGVNIASLVESAKLLVEAADAYADDRLGDDYIKLRDKIRRLDSVVSDIEIWANNELKRRLEKLELRLSAADLVKILDSIEEGRIRIPEVILETIEEVRLEAANRLVEEIGDDHVDIALLTAAIEPEGFLGLRVKEENMREARMALERRAALARLHGLQRLASRVENHLWVIDAAYRVLLEADYMQALRRYTEELGSANVLADSGWLGVGVVDGRELEIVQRQGVQSVDPVSYSIGCTGYRPAETNCEKIILLTGANSGGKTTLLKLLAETVVLAQSGLPAPARTVYLGPFDRVYYISKPTGMLSAGALETLLKNLARILEESTSRRVLVLVDELEAVTEANAAARIIASFIEQLVGRNAVAVIVTHMAEDIVRLVDSKVRENIRIDGIEARGLDEHYNLMVDRTPRYNYVARSTPELVVKKLLNKSSRSSEKTFYNAILKKIQG